MMAARATLAFLATFACSQPAAKSCILPTSQPSRKDIERIASSGCTRIDGDFHLGAFCTSPSQCVDSDLSGAVDLGSVKEIIGSLTCLKNNNLNNTKMDQLQSIGGDLTIEGSEAMPYWNFTALQSIAGNLSISGKGCQTPAMTLVRMDALQSVGGHLIIEDHYEMTTVRMGALQTVGSYMKFRANTVLLTFLTGALQSIGGYLKINRNDILTAVNMSALVTLENALDIAENPKLRAVDMRGLLSLGSVNNIQGDAADLTLTVNSCLDSSALREKVNKAEASLVVQESTCSPTSSPTSSPTPAAGTGGSGLPGGPSGTQIGGPGNTDDTTDSAPADSPTPALSAVSAGSPVGASSALLCLCLLPSLLWA